MIFSSVQYLIFLPVVVLLYWRTTGGIRLGLIVLASYFFYMSWLPIYGILLLILTCANWYIGLKLKTSSNQLRKLLLTAGLVINLGCLCYYKYTNFLLSNIASLLSWTKLHSGSLLSEIPSWNPPLINVLLPLGISFFVFEFVHYLIDVYKGDKPIESWMEFAAFSAFFPSQIAGPIKRYQDFMGRLRKPEPWSKMLFNEGMTLIMQGLFKKIAIADPLGAIVYLGFSSSQILSSPDAIIASIGFVIQVYCDFSGYTDIGRGSALLLGIRLPENFQLPYLAHDLADFWRRWHMSLSYWLRDYVYIPLGGSKLGRLSCWRNLFVTMVACGLWHGADWHYVIFGSMQGIGLIANREWRNLTSRVRPLDAALNSLPGKQLGTLITMSFITVSYVVFRAPDLEHAFFVLSGLCNFTDACNLAEPLIKCGVLQLLFVYAAMWLLIGVIKESQCPLGWLYDSKSGFRQPIKWASWTAAVVLMLAAKPVVATPFVYFQF